MRFPVIAAALIVLLAACAKPGSQQASPSQSPLAGSSSLAAASPTPSPSPSPSVSATPISVPAAGQQTAAPPAPNSSTGSLPAATPPPPTVAPGATLAPGAAVAPQTESENAPPQIIDLHLDKTTVQSGEVVSGLVRTSLNTASVEARIGGYGISVPKIGAGRFALRYAVPNLPFFLKRTYDMVVIARNTAGVKTERTVPITIR